LARWGISPLFKKVTIPEFEKQNIKYVPRDDNPPNVPQLRTIEAFWKMLKDKVYENGWEAKNKDELIKRIRQKILKMDPNVCPKLLSRVKN